jgi:putative endonuclease
MTTHPNNTTLYIGLTSNLIQRVYQDKNKQIKGFSAKYNLDKLVYFEKFDDMHNAIIRKKRLKLRKKDWKNRLINERNPNWRDLYPNLLE